MKKSILFVIILSFLLVSSLVLFSLISVQSDLENLGEGLQEKIQKVEDIKTEIEETKWDYLGQEWKKILLKNEFVSLVDSFLEKISFVFEILFAEKYSLSLTLFLMVLLWLYLFFKFTEIFRDYSAFSSGVSIILALSFTIILAHFQILRKIIEFFGWLVFSQEAGLWRFFIILIIIFIMFFLYSLSSKLGEAYKKEREKTEKEREKKERAFLHTFVEAIRKAFG